MGISAPVTAFGQGLYAAKATNSAGIALGSLMENSGRTYRFGQAGAAALVAGQVLQMAVPVANNVNLAVVIAAPATQTNIGDRTVTVTLGASPLTANQYAGGYVNISTGPGNGYVYQIASHPAALSGNVTINLNEPMQVPLTSASKVDLVANPYAGVIATPATTLTGGVVGIATSPCPANGFDWFQVGGSASVLIAGTPAVGQSVSAPSAVAGAAAINSGTLAIIGQMLATGVDTKNCPVLLTGFVS